MVWIWKSGRFIGGFRHQKGQSLRNRPADDHQSQAKIGEQGHLPGTGRNAETFQKFPKQLTLLLAKELTVFGRKPAENMLLPFDRQDGDTK